MGECIPKFCEAINAGDAHALSLAPLVRELALSLWVDEHDRPSPKPYEKTMNGILSFRNLTKLDMRLCSTSPAIMEQFGKLVQLQWLRTWGCRETEDWDEESHSTLSNLQSLHTLDCQEDGNSFSRHLACVSMKNLRILKSSDFKVIEALLTTVPSVQLKELWLTQHYNGDYSLLWNYLAGVTSLTHLSLPYLTLQEGPPASLNFPFQELQYLHIHVAFAPRFENQPLKVMRIDTESNSRQAMVEVRQHWRGVVFPHVEYLETDLLYDELIEIPIVFWSKFLLNINVVGFKSAEWDG